MKYISLIGTILFLWPFGIMGSVAAANAHPDHAQAWFWGCTLLLSMIVAATIVNFSEQKPYRGS